MNHINLFTISATPNTMNVLQNDIATRKAVIEKKLVSKCKEYDRWVEMRDASNIYKFKLSAYQKLEELNQEIDDLKATLASFYKKIN